MEPNRIRPVVPNRLRELDGQQAKRRWSVRRWLLAFVILLPGAATLGWMLGYYWIRNPLATAVAVVLLVYVVVTTRTTTVPATTRWARFSGAVVSLINVASFLGLLVLVFWVVSTNGSPF
jgi:hypothetical protein